MPFILPAALMLLAIAANLLPPAAAAATTDQSSDCLPIIAQAEDFFRLPPGLLGAIAVTESGRDGTPHPWALNIAGAPMMAANYAVAVTKLRRPDGSPRRDVAIGCMQIHMRYHLDRVTSPEWALKPPHNVWYAARFLDRLHRRYGDWLSAIAHYHGSAPAAQRSYLCRVASHLDATSPATRTALGLAGCAAGRHAAAGVRRRARPGPPVRDQPRLSIMAARQAAGILLLGGPR